MAGLVIYNQFCFLAIHCSRCNYEMNGIYISQILSFLKLQALYVQETFKIQDYKKHDEFSFRNCVLQRKLN